jgi:hypothetical protein
MYLNFTSGIQKIYYFSCTVLDRVGMGKNLYNCTFSCMAYYYCFIYLEVYGKPWRPKPHMNNTYYRLIES